MPARQQRRRRLHHIPSPYKMVSAQVIIGFRRSPWNRRGRDESASIGLVLMRQDDRVRDTHELPVVGRDGRQRSRRERPMPLCNEPFAMFGVGCSQRLHHARESRMVTVSQRDRNRELAVFGYINLTHQSDVAVQRLPEVPLHTHMRGEVLVPIARAHIAAARAREAAVSTERQRHIILPREDAAVPRDVERARRIPCSPAIQMRCQQRIALQPRQDLLVAFYLHVHQHNGVMRIGDEFLRDFVPPANISGDYTNGKRVLIDVVEVIVQVPLIFVEKSLLVREQKFHVAGLGMVDRRVINLVERTVRGGEPDTTGGGIGRAHRIFLARSPTRFKPRGAKCWSIVIEPSIVLTQSAHKNIRPQTCREGFIASARFLHSANLNDVAPRTRMRASNPL